MERKWKRHSAGVWAVLLIVWLAVLLAATVYSVWRRNQSMITVSLIKPQPGTLTGTVNLDAEVTDQKLALIEVSIYENIPQSMLAEGRDMGIGRILTCEQAGENWRIQVALEEEHDPGDILTAELSCTPEDTFEQVIDAAAIYPGVYGQPCVYEVEEEMGCWGKEYHLVEKTVSCFPMKFSRQESVAVFTDLEEEVAVAMTDEMLADGMAVRVLQVD